MPESAFDITQTRLTHPSHSIWRDPDEQKQSKKSTKKRDPTVAARSSIRRRASIHGNRNRRALQRESTIPPPPRLEHSPPPVPAIISVRNSRRNAVPPNIPTLFEHAGRSSALPPPPPPVPHSRNYYTLEQRERELRDSLEELHAQAFRLRRDAQDLITGSGDQAGDPWTETERRSLLETAAAAHSQRPRLSRLRARTNYPSRNTDTADSQTQDDVWRSPFVPIALESDEPAEGQQSTDAAPRSVLPTPPLDHSEQQDGDSLFLSEGRATISRPLHPLSRSWRADSPPNGLGDRNRSPTPGDAWEIMETTIEPDATLPSAESSFGTLPATNSFASSNDTTITEPERGPAYNLRHRYSAENRENDDDDSNSDSSSSVDLDCTDEEYMAQAESFAREMYHYEMSTPEGRARIESLPAFPDHINLPVDVGFRLIDDALNTEEGRSRVANLHGEDAVHRIVRFRNQPQSPPYRPHSPPATSHDPPSANPVSPPSRRSLRDFSDVLLNDFDSDEQDLDHMRRVARRLAMRDDVPDDWWASMGLNSSIARPRHARPRQNRRARSPDGVRRADMHAERAIGRVRGGRVERGDARL